MPDLSLEQVLADARGDAQVLRRRGHARDAEMIENLCDEIAAAAEDYLRFVSEPDAILRSGKSKGWFRRHFPEWERLSMAKRDGNERLYRLCVVPVRANLIAARRAGREAVA